MDRGPIQADRAQGEHPHLLRHQQHLYEQPLEVGQEGGAEGGDGVVVGVAVARAVAERHRFVRRALDRARPEHPGRVPIEQLRRRREEAGLKRLCAFCAPLAPETTRVAQKGGSHALVNWLNVHTYFLGERPGVSTFSPTVSGLNVLTNFH